MSLFLVSFCFIITYSFSSNTFWPLNPLRGTKQSPSICVQRSYHVIARNPDSSGQSQCLCVHIKHIEYFIIEPLNDSIFHLLKFLLKKLNVILPLMHLTKQKHSRNTFNQICPVKLLIAPNNNFYPNYSEKIYLIMTYKDELIII